MRIVALSLLLGCHGADAVECGAGTRLADGKCVAIVPTTMPVAVAVDATTADATAPSGWRVDIQEDKMRGTSVVSSSLQSTNAVQFGTPYGGSRMMLVLRRSIDGEARFLGIMSGQFDCSRKCTIEAKFDEGKVQTIEVDSGTTSSSVFVSDDKWVESLRKAKHLMIEASFFQEGKRQFSFDLDGLQWPPPNSPDSSTPLWWCTNGGLRLCVDDRGMCESLASINSATCHAPEKLWCFQSQTRDRMPSRVCRESKAGCDHMFQSHAAEGYKPKTECVEATQRVP